MSRVPQRGRSDTIGTRRLLNGKAREGGIPVGIYPDNPRGSLT